ncbi:hypothetical protein AB0I28_06040 [Phytomonospora sp. NPDC050363]|uniref:hypothetical protein n=1 Tax=Phytomonospora sp. NPDC050363 TaxID=3155642 RepID=UPI0033EDD1D8
MDDFSARPRAIPRALVAAVIGWVATAVHMSTFLIVIIGFPDRRNPGDGRLLATLYVLLPLATLVLVPLGFQRLYRGLPDGRVLATVGGTAVLPGAMCCTAFIGFAAMSYQNVEYPEPVRDTLALVSGLASAGAAVAMVAVLLYLWQTPVTHHLRSPLARRRTPRPSGPGQW